MPRAPADRAMARQPIANRILYHLDDQDLATCSLVNKNWHRAVCKYSPVGKIRITTRAIAANKNRKAIPDIVKDFPFASKINIYAKHKQNTLSSEHFNQIFTSDLACRNARIHNQGNWTACRCPVIDNSKSGQIDTATSHDLTNLEYLHINHTFAISACALLDLIARSPKLKVLKFHGIVTHDDHMFAFEDVFFRCNLEQIFWPWPRKEEQKVLRLLAKRNEHLTTFCSNVATVCTLLSLSLLPQVKFLSIFLNEQWSLNKPTRNRRYLSKIKYLSSAKEVEALELRTLAAHESEDGDSVDGDDAVIEIDIDDEDVPKSSKKNAAKAIKNKKKSHELELARIKENYQIEFWKQLAKMHKLRYLAIYGNWEFESVCSEMVKHGVPVEYLKINLVPTSLVEQIDNAEEMFTLSMSDGLKCLRKLANLRSVHYICHEKLAAISKETVNAFKDILDLIWMIDIKVGYTEELEELLHSIMRRGNQLGKSYKITVFVDTGDDQESQLFEVNLKLNPGESSFKAKIFKLIEAGHPRGRGRLDVRHIFVWGIEQIANCRNKSLYDDVSEKWNYYDDKFVKTATHS